MIEVQYVGPTDAKIYLVGEAPGEQEVDKGEPFCGGAGRILNALLMSAGIHRAKCRIGNLALVRPPGNNFGWFLDRNNPEGEAHLVKGMTQLDKDIKQVKPNVICALGAAASVVLCGRSKITKIRGSIYWSDEYNCKVIPTIHPAAIMRMWDYSPLALFDLKRVKLESESRELDIPKRELVVAPTFEIVYRELERLMKVKRVAFDIETQREEGHKNMLSIAFSDNPNWAICIPFENEKGEPYFSLDEEIYVLKKIKNLLESDVEKVAQNAQFDVGFLSHHNGINVNNLVLDTMCAQHTLYPELKKGLDILCSIFTKQPYYKDMIRGGAISFWQYNALDACICFEVGEKIEGDMREFGVWDFYHKLVHPLIPVLLDMQLRGVKIDEGVMREALRMEEERVASLEDFIRKETELPHLNINSPAQLKELFYRKMQLPIKINRKTKKESADEDAINELSAAFPQHRLLFDSILEYKKKQKLISNYLTVPLLKGRMHTSYNIGGRIEKDDIVSGPETGRLSSSKSIVLDSGTNLQNIPKGDCRRMFIPDEGKMFISVDLSQAEARVVAYLAGEDKLIEAFKSEGDVFREVAGWIFNKDISKVGEEERTTAKRMTHALNYGMGPRTFSVYSKVEYRDAKDLIVRYFDTFPNIRKWQMGIEAKLRKSRILVTPMGRKRQFFDRWGPQLLREAYAYKPQSTVADVLNLAMLYTKWDIWDKEMDAQLILQVHDEFIVQCKPDDVDTVCKIIRGAFDISIKIGRGELVIPIKIKIGKNWDEMKEVT